MNILKIFEDFLKDINNRNVEVYVKGLFIHAFLMYVKICSISERRIIKVSSIHI